MAACLQEKPKVEAIVLSWPSYEADILPAMECFVLKK